MFISFRYPNYVAFSLIALLAGFILSQVGIHYSNRFGRSPRPDELLSQALKGLAGKYTLYHYSSPVSHLLIGPAGVWILLPQHQRGKITYTNGRWRQKGGNWYLKLFAHEGLGRPDVEIAGDIQSLLKFFKTRLPEEQVPSIQAALVFTNPNVDIQVSEDENPPAETIPLNKLKELIRKSARGTQFTIVQATLVNQCIVGE